MAIVKWLPFVNSYMERQKRIVELRSECVEKALQLKIQRIQKECEELAWDTIRSAMRIWCEPLSYHCKRFKAERIYAVNLQIAQAKYTRLDNNKRYLQGHYDLISDEKILKAESINPTMWC